MKGASSSTMSTAKNWNVSSVRTTNASFTSGWQMCLHIFSLCLNNTFLCYYTMVWKNWHDKYVSKSLHVQVPYIYLQIPERLNTFLISFFNVFYYILIIWLGYLESPWCDRRHSFNNNFFLMFNSLCANAVWLTFVSGRYLAEEQVPLTERWRPGD